MLLLYLEVLSKKYKVLGYVLMVRRLLIALESMLLILMPWLVSTPQSISVLLSQLLDPPLFVPLLSLVSSL